LHCIVSLVQCPTGVSVCIHLLCCASKQSLEMA
jgi:hypothetical protein